MAENFLTYTKIDPNNHITVTNTRVTQDSWHNESAYVYKDYGIDYFGDFIHSIDIELTGGSNNRARQMWLLANGIDDFVGLWDNPSENFVTVYAIKTNPSPRIYLCECNGADASNQTSYDIALNTTYYLTMQKVGTALTCKIYSDSARTTLLTTLSITLGHDYSFRYVYPATTWNNGIAEHADGWCENLVLGGTTPMSGVSASGLWPSETYLSGYSPRYQKRQIIGYFGTSGDLRSVEVNASGHLYTDVTVSISGMDIEVNISGDPVIISGQPVTISGDHIYVESGAFPASGVGVVVQSGVHVIISGQPVTISGSPTTIGGALVQVPVDLQSVYKTHTDEWSGFLGSGDTACTSGADVSTYQKIGLYVQASGSWVIDIQASHDDTSGNYCDYDGYDPLISGFQGCKRYSFGHYPFEYVRARLENMGASGQIQIRWARAT